MISPKHWTLPSATQIWRIFRTRHLTACQFNDYGPIGRFDHHNVPGSRYLAPANDPNRRVYYFGFTVRCCVVECFKDIGKVTYAERGIVHATITRDLLLLDLRGKLAKDADAPMRITKSRLRPLTQKWSRQFYENPGSYGEIDGIIWENRHNGEESMVLYERAEDGLICPATKTFPLTDSYVRDEIDDAAMRNGIAPGP